MSNILASGAIEKISVDNDADDSNFTPRPYQDELCEIAIKKNSIIYLPTGSGKTFIAILVMKYFSKDLRLPLNSGGKRTVFIVNTVVLTQQQMEYIQNVTSLKTKKYSGDMNVDTWKKNKWFNEFDENQVLVATCQIILDVIRHGYISLKHINLIIFDECHHGNKMHPMHQLMRHFMDIPVADQPRVIGLTGMLLNNASISADVVLQLEALENTFRSTIITVKNIREYNNVLLYSTNPIEDITKYDIPTMVSLVETRIKSRINKCIETITMYRSDDSLAPNKNDLNVGQKKPMKSLAKLFCDFIYQMTDLGLYGASIAILALIIELELKRRSCETSPMRRLLRSLITEAELIRHIIVKEMNDNDESDEEEDVDDLTTILTYSSPKVQVLLLKLKQYFAEHSDDENTKGLVFVHRRFTAKCLYHIIKRYAEALTNCSIRVDFMVGCAAMSESIDVLLENKWNRRVVERFKKHETNLIVASSVLEEGVDLQMCNLVITFDNILSFRSYIQMKGRARKSDSRYVIMIPRENYFKLLTKLEEFRKIDKCMKDFLIGKAIDRPPPDEKDIKREHGYNLIKPFRTSKAILEDVSAVQLLNRYCMSLPHDHFTVSTAIWKRTDTPKGIIVTITLPMQSTVREEVTGEYMPNIKMAKRSAAFNACIKLYRMGELNENLFPITSRTCIESVANLYFKKYDGFPQDKASDATLGTHAKKRLYNLQHNIYTTGCLPKLHTVNYLYIMKITPAFKADGDFGGQEFHHLYASNRNFGILTAKKLPKLALMKLYVTLGQINCQISHVPVEVIFNELSTIDKLKNFHAVLFINVLKICKPFFICDYSNNENSFFVVPTINKLIDWDIIESFQIMIPCREKSLVERAKQEFNPEDYFHKVVAPCYRVDEDTRYVVIKIHENLTPCSAFPNDYYPSYADYFKDKYGKELANINQFMIEVKAITSNYNMLHPGQGEDGSKSSSVRGPEILIPELCHNFQFPGDLWLKATLIPSILHRLQYLLKAEVIRRTFNNYLDIDDNSYVPMEIQETIKRRDPDLDKKVAPKSIIIPNPATTPAIKIKKSDIIAYTDNQIYDWNESHEPTDLNRNSQHIYPIDIEYYYKFMSDFKNLSLSTHSSSNGRKYNPSNLAICDTKIQQKRKIQLLDIDDNTQIMGPEQRDILAGITTLKSGDVFDMERFEIIGDAFLKFAVSSYLLRNHTTWHEGFLTSCKGQIVSNRNLCYVAINLFLPGLMNDIKFNAKNDWLPPLFKVPPEIQTFIRDSDLTPQLLYRLKLLPEEILSGKLKEESFHAFKHGCYNETLIDTALSIDSTMHIFVGQQCVNDKSAADAVEALLGIYLQSVGIGKTYSILQLLDILPSGKNLNNFLNEEFKCSRVRTNIRNIEVDDFLINYQLLEKTLGYVFKDRAILLQALTHPSFPTNCVTGCYQQLEFLGDSVLDFLVTQYIYEKCPYMDPGQLTDLRSALVNNVTLACICVRNKFHLHILSQNAVLSETISKFVAFQKKHNHEITDQVQLLIEEKDVDMAEHIDVPKTLGDVLEAIIGGVYLDSGNDLQITWNIIYGLLENELHEFMANVPVQIIRKLFEYPGASPKFQEPFVDEEIVMVTVTFTKGNEILEVSGFGQNKQDAKTAAAKLALYKLTAD